MNDKAYRITSIISFIFIIIIGLMIFFFSSENAEASTKTSSKFTDAYIALFYKNFDELSASEQNEIRSNAGHTIRKLAHFTEFFLFSFVLMIFVYNILMHLKKNSLWSFLYTIPIGVVYAITDEFHQKFVGGRAPAFTDVLIDSSGVVFGAIISFLLLTIIKRSIIKKENKLISEGNENG